MSWIGLISKHDSFFSFFQAFKVGMNFRVGPNFLCVSLDTRPVKKVRDSSIPHSLFVHKTNECMNCDLSFSELLEWY